MISDNAASNKQEEKASVNAASVTSAADASNDKAAAAVAVKAVSKKPKAKARAKASPVTSTADASKDKVTSSPSVTEALPELTNAKVAAVIGGKILVAEYPKDGKRKVAERPVSAEHILSHTLTENKLVAVLADGSKRVLERS